MLEILTEARAPTQKKPNSELTQNDKVQRRISRSMCKVLIMISSSSPHAADGDPWEEKQGPGL